MTEFRILLYTENEMKHLLSDNLEIFPIDIQNKIKITHLYSNGLNNTLQYYNTEVVEM